MAEQHLLDITLPRRRAFEREDFFVSASNETALAMIEGWADWPNRQLLLTGPQDSGKTHLAHVWMETSGAERVAAKNLREADVAALTSIGAVVIEDLDRGVGEATEKALFHLLNLSRADGAYLLLTAQTRPAQIGFSLRDLVSRLSGMTQAAIDEPDEALMRDLIVKQFRDRHLIVSQTVVSFLARRIERSAEGAAKAVERLDDASRAEAQAITIPFIRRHMTF